MSMAHALELRVPVIGREVVEAVFSLPDEVLGWGEPKALLREAVGPVLPPDIGRGPKKGFTLGWRTLLRRGGPWKSLGSDVFLSGAVKRVWEMWHGGRLGFA
jgi:hypothetical protein